MCDPLNPYKKQMKEISGKRKKTDDDQIAMARIEWEAGLYLNKAGRVVWPGTNLERMILDAAKKIKMGTLVKSALMIPDDIVMDADYPKDLDKMFESCRIASKVKVGMASIIRTRPIFDNWSLTFKVLFNEELLNPRDLQQILDIAGAQIGLGDWRPRFGRFVVESVS
jgi:hypothetical protein